MAGSYSNDMCDRFSSDVKATLNDDDVFCCDSHNNSNILAKRRRLAGLQDPRD